MQELCSELWEEVHKDFQTSMQKSVVDYILMDSMELRRLRIASLPPQHPRHVLRAPLPWHETLCQARDAQAIQLFVTSEVVRELQQLWFTKSVVVVVVGGGGVGWECGVGGSVGWNERGGCGISVMTKIR